MHIVSVIKDFVKNGIYTSFSEYYKTLVESKVDVNFDVDENDEFDELYHEEFYNDLIDTNISEIMDIIITYSKNDEMDIDRSFFEFNFSKFTPEKIIEIYKKCGHNWYGWTSSPQLPRAIPDIMCDIIDKKDAEIIELQKKIKELESK